MILVCGEALYDVFPDGTEQAGGSPFNVAVGLARLGSKAALATTLSDDPRGRALRAVLEREGVDGRFLRRTSRPTPLARVAVGPSGTPDYRFEGLADLDVHAAVPLPPNVTCLHTGSFALVSPRSAAPLLALFEEAPASTLLSLDPNVRLAMEPSVSSWRSAVAAFATRADLIKVSEEDLTCLAGGDPDVDATAARWLSGRCALVAVTRGERGASLYTRRHKRVDIAGAPVEVVDCVGAGDAFQAALLAWLDGAGLCSRQALALLDLAQLRRLLEAATMAGAIACSRRGPDPPTKAELRL